MKHPSYRAVVDKSRAACVAAIETYNRASAPYREETFAILMINAWELLLKARVMKENHGKRAAIYAREKQRKKDGTVGTRWVVKRSRSNQPLTINITRAYALCANYAKDPIDQPCIENINALIEVRDLATHFVTHSPILKKTLGELAMAAVKNYVVASQKWFNATYSDLNIASIPLSFHLDQMDIEAAAKSAPAHVMNFLRHLAATEKALGSSSSDFAFTVRVSFDLVKKKTLGGLTASIVDGADLKVSLDEDWLREKFPWGYKDLGAKLEARYSDFKQNEKYHKVRKAVENDKNLCHVRLLNPSSSKSAKTRLYSQNIIQHFDKYYTRKPPGKPQPAAPQNASVFD